MQCVTPLFREYEIGTNKTIRIVPRAEVMDGLINYDNDYIRHKLNKINAKTLEHGRLTQTIPCGHCYACKLNKSAEWATRCMLETLKSEHNYWITLTYDEDHVPIAEETKWKIENQDGTFQEITYKNEGDEIWCTGCLIPEDATNFLKRLREYLRSHYDHTGVKVYYCGEYGSLNARPHFHMLLFNCPIPMEESYDFHIDENFKEHWKNRIIEELWQHNGMVDITEIEWSNAAYTARYTMKKVFNERTDQEYYASGKIPEFVRMSRRPGIGMDYYEQNKFKIYENDELIMKTVKGNTGSIKPPKAFDKLFKEQYPEQYNKIERRRKELARKSRNNLYYITDMTDFEILKNKSESITTKSKMLKREL